VNAARDTADAVTLGATVPVASWKAREVLSLALIVGLSFCLMSDMFIMPAIIPELTQEYGVSASAIGWAGSAFMLAGALLGLMFGAAADRYSRKRLLIVTVLLGEVPCVLTGVRFFTDSFEGFVVMRLLTGIGVGGIYPIVFSLLADLVSERHRAKASALVDIFWGLGMLSGPLWAAYALTTDYGWRLAFILAALPSLPLVLLYAWLGTEPQRGAREEMGSVSHALPWRRTVRDLFRRRSNVLLFLQGIPGSLPWGVLPFWVISFYREVRGFDAMTATSLWEIFGVVTVVGTLLWASVGDWLFNRRPRHAALLCTVVIALGMLPMFALFNFEWPRYQHYLWLAICGGLLISVASSNIRAFLMNVNPPEQRGSAFAVFNLTDTIGKGVGPALGGMILAASQNYQLMLNVAVSFWSLCVVIFLGVVFTIDRDRAALQRRVAPG
jgi:MFS family permease